LYVPYDTVVHEVKLSKKFI